MTVFAAAGFEWDEGNRAKCQKHGLAVEDIEDVLKGDIWVGADQKHSTAETRYIAMGRGGGVRPIFVVFTLRRRGDKLLIWPISARYMHRKEIERYEEKTKEDSATENR